MDRTRMSCVAVGVSQTAVHVKWGRSAGFVFFASLAISNGATRLWCCGYDALAKSISNGAMRLDVVECAIHLKWPNYALADVAIHVKWCNTRMETRDWRNPRRASRAFCVVLSLRCHSSISNGERRVGGDLCGVQVSCVVCCKFH